MKNVSLLFTIRYYQCLAILQFPHLVQSGGDNSISHGPSRGHKNAVTAQKSLAHNFELYCYWYRGSALRILAIGSVLQLNLQFILDRHSDGISSI